MFSSGLSLRNNIKEIDNELTAYTISNDALKLSIYLCYFRNF